MIRGKYFSNSKLANIIRGTIKPKCETAEGWREWNINAKNKHPIRYYIAEEMLDQIQDIINFIPDKIHNIKCYIRNRFITKTHVLSSALTKGKWHEFDDRLLHCIFDEFVDFVEIEKAHMLSWSGDDVYKSLKKDKITGRCPEAGVKYLEWESSLIDEFEKSPNFGKPSRQAISAQWQLQAYNWWKFDRKNRPDPDELSGYNAYYEKRYPNGMKEFHDIFITDDEIRNIIKKTSDIEKQYYDEDTKYLTELIKRRQEFWT